MITLEDIADALDGVISGDQVLAPGPDHSPEDRSLSVKITDEGKILVHSHAGDEKNKCYVYVREQLKKFDHPLDEIKFQANKTDARDTSRTNTQQFALKIWGAARDPLGTIVETYLQSRGLEVTDMFKGTIRFDPSCPFGGGEKQPCMIAAFRSIPTGEVVAIHRTSLTQDGCKIDRRMLGPVDGAAIMFGEIDPERGELMIGEGIETTMSGLCLRESPAWAMGSAKSIARFPVVPGVKILTILGEHDAASEAAIRECAERWRAAGREVLIAKPKPGLGNDANDAWQHRQALGIDLLDVVEFAAGVDAGISQPASANAIKATPFIYCDPAALPTRQWLYDRHYIRKFVSTTVAPGGVGKSSLGIVEALAMVTGKELLGTLALQNARSGFGTGKIPGKSWSDASPELASTTVFPPKTSGDGCISTAGGTLRLNSLSHRRKASKSTTN